jgi:hypothetical protein
LLKTDIHHDSVDHPAREVLSLAIGNLTKLLVIALEASCVLRGREDGAGQLCITIDMG